MSEMHPSPAFTAEQSAALVRMLTRAMNMSGDALALTIEKVTPASWVADIRAVAASHKSLIPEWVSAIVYDLPDPELDPEIADD